MKTKVIVFSIILAVCAVMFLQFCGPSPVEPVKVGGIADSEMDPSEWGKVYPLEYESWLKTAEPKAKNSSRYRRGWDQDKIIYDRLSEYPFSAVLYNGWGFGIEYNEPRGHMFAIQDQVDIDPSRTGAGGVCLACKSPYHKSLVEKEGMNYLKARFSDALNMLPDKMRKTGPSCSDCHQAKTMAVRPDKPHYMRGLAMLGKEKLTRQESRIAACGQCHMTYYVPRDKDKKVAGDANPPWKGSKWGDISIENIIADLLSDASRIEWTQKVTAEPMQFIRHPEFELFSRGSVHWNAGVACADCHMPYTRSGAYKISDHNVTSPLKADLRACSQCHTESAEWIRKQVYEIQDRTASLLIRAGYECAAVAKLIEMSKANNLMDAPFFHRSVDLYRQAFLRVVFIGAENSSGFHNPSETKRVLGDAIMYAGRAEGLLRQTLALKGIQAPEKPALNLSTYLNGRGMKKLMFKKDQQVKDPYNLQGIFSEMP